jgi:hypothetical protein
MPRNTAGVYILPVGNPVAAGTLIESTWANGTLDDVATALTDSLSRSGSGGMLAPFYNADGTKSAPGASWTNEPTSGWYRKSTGEFWFSVAGQDVFKVSAAGIELAAGMTTLGLDAPVRLQDPDPAPTPKGIQWFESDTGAFYVRYENPDHTFVWIQTNPTIGGNYLPATDLHLFLKNAVDDSEAAAAGVALGAMYRTGNAVKVRIV